MTTYRVTLVSTETYEVEARDKDEARQVVLNPDPTDFQSGKIRRVRGERKVEGIE